MSLQRDTKYRAYIHEASDVKAALQAGLQFIRWEKYVNRRSRVFVKPNFTFPTYKPGVTTSPEFLRVLLTLLKSRAGQVIVGESDGGNHAFTAAEAFQGHNMPEICQQTGAELVNLSGLPAKTVESDILGKKVTVRLPRLLLEDIDCFISVPVLKIHVMTTVSLSLKNLWGCVPDTMRCLHHQNLNYKLALIAQLLQPKIVVIDGTYALNKHGPMYGEAVKTNLVMVADNPVVADALGARLLGFSPQQVKTIILAEEAGLGSARLSDVVVTEGWQRFKRQFQIEKTLIDRISSLFFRSDLLAKLVMDSPLTAVAYKVAGKLRTPAEKELASQMGKKLGPYC
ncbi:MAG: DUF362 domain-containing protein [Chloroflexota bacterium]|nr:DUF362 domain-containing protein [Chloroflexota bacterium]